MTEPLTTEELVKLNVRQSVSIFTTGEDVRAISARAEKGVDNTDIISIKTGFRAVIYCDIAQAEHLITSLQEAVTAAKEAQREREDVEFQQQQEVENE